MDVRAEGEGEGADLRELAPRQRGHKEGEQPRDGAEGRPAQRGGTPEPEEGGALGQGGRGQNPRRNAEPTLPPPWVLDGS